MLAEPVLAEAAPAAPTRATAPPASTAPPESAASAAPQTAAGGVERAESFTHTVHHEGNRYFATRAMAEIFHLHAERSVESGVTELVPLLHSEGVELLAVGPKTVFAVVSIDVGAMPAATGSGSGATTGTGVSASHSAAKSPRAAS